jgi:serine/threonine-protein kinase HipA
VIARPNRLDVYFGDELVGTLTDTSPLSFEYEAAWLNRADAWPIAGIPLLSGAKSSVAMHAFFENLLPEGERRLYLIEERKSSTLFALLLAVAGDTSGGFCILPEGQKPQTAEYEITSWARIAVQLGKESASAIDIRSSDARISLAGAQDKSSIAIFSDGLPRLPKGTAPATHILKPNIKRLAKVWHSAANETIIMKTAANCGLPSAEVFYEPLTQSCIVKRFDRLAQPDGTLRRLIQYDFCQLSGALSDRKYESEGGPSLADCAALIRQYSAQPAVDLRHFIQWIFFNLYTGNNDSHAKNLSVFQDPDKGVILTPFYDLLCTRLYPGLSPAFAFALGNETRPGAITKVHVTMMANQLRVHPKFVLKQAQELADKIPAAISHAVNGVSPLLTDSAKTLADRLQRFVITTTKRTAARILE